MSDGTRGAADLRVLGERVRPATLAAERALPVLAPFAGLLPQGGLRRGTSVAVQGAGSTSLALALLAGASRAGSWTAVVGVPTLGLAAAGELGLDLERTVVVGPPEPSQWATVVAALAEAFELVVVRPTHRVRPGDARRLAARARERGGVLCRLPSRGGTWPEGADLTCTVADASWRGIDTGGTGAGRLRARRVTLTVEGRRGASLARTAHLWLPGPDGTVAVAAAAQPAVPDRQAPLRPALVEAG